MMARVVRFHQVGGPEVLQIDTVDLPELQEGEVLINVKALGLNRAEAMFRSGLYLEEPQLPAKLGYEAAGIVEAVGPNVENIYPGEPVSTVPIPSMNKYGVYGDQAIVPAVCVVKNPKSLSFNEAAACWMQYLTAYGALIWISKITKGDYVLIPAASSSVGIAAIQLCNAVGAIPIAATRTAAKKKSLENIGAAHVIVTDEEDLTKRALEITHNKGIRVAFDPVGGKGVTAIAKAMAPGGIIIEYGALSAEHTPFPLMESLKKGLTMKGYTLFELASRKELLDPAIKYIIDSLNLGILKPVIAKTFKLDDIIEAHRYLESNQQFGKIIVTV